METREYDSRHVRCCVKMEGSVVTARVARSATGMRHSAKSRRRFSVSVGLLATLAFVSLHAHAVRAGTVVAWGKNNAGQLGNSRYDDRGSPVAVIGLSSDVTAIAAGGSHSLAVQYGALFGWGSGYYGQLGI